jgi:hypothetical protein
LPFDIVFYPGTGLGSADFARAALAAVVVNSREAEQKGVSGFYQHFLHRSADAGGVSLFAGALLQGARDEDVMAALAGSDEYLIRP